MPGRFHVSLRDIPEHARIGNIMMIPACQSEFQRHVISMFQMLGLDPERDALVISFEKTNEFGLKQ